MVVAVIIATTCAVLRGSVIDASFAAAAATFALACNQLPSPDLFLWFCTISGVIVAAAVVQDSHRLAFYDELTGLPGRRALNERLESLDGGFTLAMVDIDRFKAFNDTWGHEVGDQVLKLVAAHARHRVRIAVVALRDRAKPVRREKRRLVEELPQRQPQALGLDHRHEQHLLVAELTHLADGPLTGLGPALP